MRVFVVALLTLGAAAALVVFIAFRSDLARARAALWTHEARTVDTAHGAVEYAEMGDGPVVLSIHGTGGGYDQGLALARPLAAAGYRIVAPSRFGYLGTPIPSDSGAPAQADAFADLLDTLGIDRAIVIGTSAGAITALHFAARHPDRTVALIPLVPAYYPPTGAVPEPWSPLKRRAVTAALRSDFLFWAGLKAAPLALGEAILATDRRLLGAIEGAERERVGAILRDILPISARADGLILDTANTARPAAVDLVRITAPTLAISAEDDRYGTADSARLIAAGIPGAELLILPDGGHVFAGRNDEVTARMLVFLEDVLAR